VVTTSAVAQSAQGALSTVRAVVARHAATVQAARFVTQHSAVGLADALTLARTVEATSPPTQVSTTVVNSTANTLPLGFSYSAPTMLVLFVFVNALAGGAAMIQTRRTGVFARALAAPVRPRDIVLGEGLCYLLLALVGALLFGVSWGNPIAAVALVGTWALVGTGAGMLSGTLFRTPEQASAIGPAVGIAFGMLGGCMWPLEIVPPAVRALGHLTPHAWAVDAWVVLLSRGGGLLDILSQLAVLLAFAVGLLVLASMRLRRSLAT
jgi:ABC-2 type transport system permease protein